MIVNLLSSNALAWTIGVAPIGCMYVMSCIIWLMVGESYDGFGHGCAEYRHLFGRYSCDRLYTP